jgi:hypothetical protein
MNGRYVVVRLFGMNVSNLVEEHPSEVKSRRISESGLGTE